VDLPEAPRPEPNPATETIAADVGHRPRPAGTAGPVAAAIRLEILGGPMDGVTARVQGSSLSIGRDPRSDLCLALDPLVSSAHARLVQDGQGYWLEDLGSRNGTFVGDQRIQSRTLIGPGAVFVVGRTHLEFLPAEGPAGL
jgi:pSer/pThr/pTyr-binding forkhead associated (FHA) protein